jgi:hypothetical protein
MEETKMLIEEKVSRTPNAKIFTIFLIMSKCFWPNTCSMKKMMALSIFLRATNLNKFTKSSLN